MNGSGRTRCRLSLRQIDLPQLRGGGGGRFAVPRKAHKLLQRLDPDRGLAGKGRRLGYDLPIPGAASFGEPRARLRNGGIGLDQSRFEPQHLLRGAALFQRGEPVSRLTYHTKRKQPLHKVLRLRGLEGMVVLRETEHHAKGGVAVAF